APADPHGFPPRRRSAPGSPGHGGVPRPRARGVPLSELPDAPAAGPRPRPQDDRPVAAPRRRRAPGHGAAGHGLAAAPSAHAAPGGLRRAAAPLERPLERAAPPRTAPHLDPPAARSK